MAQVTAALVKELRELTGAGMMDCRGALQETDGDVERAKDWLRKKGMAKAASLSGRSAREGIVAHYVHSAGGAPPKVGALVELNCETDFVARNEDFQKLGRELALQVAGARPRWVRKEDVPADVVAREQAVYADQVRGKPANIVEKILAGKIDAFYKEFCLLEQEYIRVDEHGQKYRIGDLVHGLVAKLRENITVAGFVLFDVGKPALVARSGVVDAPEAEDGTPQEAAENGAAAPAAS